ncbi:ribonuclease H-like domain-containing protein [Tanacetum coccineum]
MVTRFRVGTDRPTERLNLHVSSISPLPKSYRDVFSDPNWQNVMRDEYHALIKNKTWTLVPRPSDTNIVCCMWLFRHKYLADSTLSRYKAHLVANAWLLLDIGQFTNLMSRMRFYMRSLYGLKQASRAWFQRFASYITQVGYAHSRCDSSLFIYRKGADTAYILLYVDDIVLTTSSEIKKYDVEILKRANMANCNPIRTPIDTESKLGSNGDPVSNATLYQSLAVFSSSTTDLVAYSDADWAGCPTIRHSTSGYCVFLGNNLLSWSSKRQPTLSCSSAEAEYCSVANAITETCWLRNLLRGLHTLVSSATLVYYDNVSAVYLSCNPVQHQRTKHIEIDIHFVRDLVAAGQVRVLHVPSRYQFEDIFIKGLPSALFEEFRSSLNVCCSLAPTSGEC